MTLSSSFYVTLFRNASQEIYETYTHVDFTVKLSRFIDLGTTLNWKVGFCGALGSSLPLESVNTVDVTLCAFHAMIYYNLISPQFVGDSTVRFIWTFPTASCRHHEFSNVHYVTVEQRQFQFMRVEFLTLEGLHVHLEDSTTTKMLCFIFASISNGNFCYKTLRQHPS